MLDLLLTENGDFHNYSWEHGLCFLLSIFFIIWGLHYGKKLDLTNQKILFITCLCVAGAFTQIFKVFYKYFSGTFDVSNDVPLHLCNILAILMPFVMYFKWKKLWGITFFWIIAGCAQSLFTPTLTESLPHYEAIRYWMVHAVIVLAALYGWYVYGYKPTIQDAIRSDIGMNIVAAIIYPINVAIGANYMYLNAKPAGQTIYNLLGPWPDYIIVLEGAIVVFFSLILIPFHWKQILVFLQPSRV